MKTPRQLSFLAIFFFSMGKNQFFSTLLVTQENCLVLGSVKSKLCLFLNPSIISGWKTVNCLPSALVQFSKFKILNRATGEATNNGPTVYQVDQLACTVGTIGTLIETAYKLVKKETSYD